MKQVIKKSIKEANNISDEPLIYTLLVDGNNLMKIASVDKRMNSKGEEYGIVFQFLWQLHKLLQVKDYNFVYVMFDGEKSGQLRYQFYQDYKANRDKNYELNGEKSEYDKQIDDYVKKVLNYAKNSEIQNENSFIEYFNNRKIKSLNPMAYDLFDTL